MMSARRTMRGASLIEAAVAVALLAVMMLAVAGGQFAMARAQRSTIWRERALWLADARIESARAAPDADAGLAALAVASLPDGVMTIDGGPVGARLATVGWRDGDAAGCETVGRSARSPSCVRIPFREVPANAY
ncbi:N-terminal cleavage protein [Burkholderia ubonensis]|nr:N-terminal cleavage protein [Burkholderia ubonensis]